MMIEIIGFIVNILFLFDNGLRWWVGSKPSVSFLKFEPEVANFP